MDQFFHRRGVLRGKFIDCRFGNIMTKVIVIKIFEVSISYRVAPSRKGTHRQLAIDKN